MVASIASVVGFLGRERPRQGEVHEIKRWKASEKVKSNRVEQREMRREKEIFNLLAAFKGLGCVCMRESVLGLDTFLT